MKLYTLYDSYKNTKAVTTTYTANANDGVILADSTAGVFTITVPNAATCKGAYLEFRKTNASINTITVSGTGLTTFYMIFPNDNFGYVSNGTNWIRVFQNTSDWVTTTTTLNAVSNSPTKGTTTVDSVATRRVGNCLELNYNYRQSAAGSGGTGVYIFALPYGFNIDTAIMPVDSSNRVVCGNGYGNSSTSNDFWIEACAYSATHISMRGLNESTRLVVQSGAGNGDLSNTVVNYSFFARVPVVNG